MPIRRAWKGPAINGVRPYADRRDKHVPRLQGLSSFPMIGAKLPSKPKKPKNLRFAGLISGA